MANIGSTTIKYVFSGLRWLLGKIFDLNNIKTPLKFLAKLLLGLEFLTEREKENRRLLDSVWSALPATSVASTSRLKLKTKFLGISKALLKAIIFALASVIGFITMRSYQKSKAL